MIRTITPAQWRKLSAEAQIAAERHIRNRLYRVIRANSTGRVNGETLNRIIDRINGELASARGYV